MRTGTDNYTKRRRFAIHSILPMGSIRSTLLALAIFLAAAAHAAELRIALVIGNSDYAGGPLPNPANDAKLIGDELAELGFDVIARRNADQTAMKRAIQEFGAQTGESRSGCGRACSTMPATACSSTAAIT